MTGDQVTERTAYVYGENRFEENRYKGEALTYQESYEQLPDGTRRETRIACNGSTDRIEMAARVDQTPDGWVRQYTYDNQLKDFRPEVFPTRHLEGLSGRWHHRYHRV